MKHYLGLGYSCVKMKVGGVPLAEDLKRIEAVLKIVGAGERLAVDVNGKFDLTDRDRVRQGDRRATACAGTRSRSIRSTIWRMRPSRPSTPAARDRRESLLDAGRAQPDPPRRPPARPRHPAVRSGAQSYGLVEYLRTIDMLKANGWSPRRCVPHGGHQFALNIAVGLQCGGNESYPQVFAPFGGFADDCPVVDGRVALPDAPGIGFERKADLWAVMKEVA